MRAAAWLAAVVAVCTAALAANGCRAIGGDYLIICEEFEECADCIGCAFDHPCEAKTVRCAEDPACAALVTCQADQSCVTQECLDQCRAAYPDGIALWDDVTECGNETCATQCDLE